MTAAAKKQSSAAKKNKMKLWAVAVWLMVWQIGSMVLGETILLPAPIAVLCRLGELAFTMPFWSHIGYSTLRILGGFFSAVVFGCFLAVASARFETIKDLVTPMIAVIKAVPVASFIILMLVWIPSRWLSFAISFMMVLPPIYLNVLEGITHRNREMLEVAKVFGVPVWRRMRGLDLPQVLPYFRSACSLGLGLCWKSGIAAEVIGLPKGSLGERLYTAKIYLETPDLFAWTVTIVCISVIFEKCFLKLMDTVIRKVGV